MKCTSDPVSRWNNAHRKEPDFREKEFGAKGANGTIYSLPLVYLDDEKSYALQINAFPYLAKCNDTGAELDTAVRFTPKIYHVSTRTLIAERTVVGSTSVSASGKSNPNKIHISTNVSFNSMGRIDFVKGQRLPAGMTAWAHYFNHTPQNNTNVKGPVELDLECFVEIYGKRNSDGKRTIAGSAAQSCRWTIERLDSESGPRD